MPFIVRVKASPLRGSIMILGLETRNGQTAAKRFERTHGL